MRFAGEAGDDLAHYAHRGQDHNVDGRVRIKPEEVLEQQRIAPQRRVEDARWKARSAITNNSVIGAARACPARR